MSEPHNPPAFPYTTIDGYTNEGLSLRDYFAGQAVTGLIAQSDEAIAAAMLAAEAYMVADAMIRHREG